MNTRWISVAILGCALLGVSCSDPARDAAKNLTGGDPDRGKREILRHGCASCHTIPGIAGADALVGPPLLRMGARVYVGGSLRNTPDNMIRWLEDPPAIHPETAMPNLHLSKAQARDIASYLYTLQ